MFLKDFLPDLSLPSAAVAFIAGIAVSDLAGVCIQPAMAVAAEAAAALAFIALVIRKGEQRQREPGKTADEVKQTSLYLGRCLLLLWFCLGFLQHGGASWPKAGMGLPGGYPAAGAGLVEEVRAYPASGYAGPRYRITVRLSAHGEGSGAAAKPHENDKAWKRQQRVMLTLRFPRGDEGEASAADFGERFLAGARIRFSAVIREAVMPSNPGEFDYARYLRTRGIYCQADADVGQVVLTHKAPFWQSGLERLRRGFLRQITRYLDTRSGAVVSGCFLGDLSLMDEEDREVYRQAGIAHLFSVSGTHGGILLAAALYLEHWKPLRKRKALSRLLALGLLLFYLSLTGFPLSMRRTFIMACMMQAAAILGRKGDSATAIATAAIALLWISPRSLFGAGFQLSFGVTWGLIHLSPWLQRRLPPVLAAPIAAQLAAMPIQAYWFYQIQPVGFLINLGAVALMPPLLLLSAFAALVGAVSPTVAGFLWQAPGFLASVLDRAAHLWTSLPIAWLNIRENPWPVYLLWALLVWLLPGIKAKENALGYWLYQRHEQKRQRDEWAQWRGWRLAKKQQIDARERERATNTGIGMRDERHDPASVQAGQYRGAPDRGETLTVFKPRRSGPDVLWLAWQRRRLLVAILIALYAAIYLVAPGPLRIYFLDVGQGDGIFFTTPSGNAWMIDGGSSNVSRLGAYRLAPFLRSRGIGRLDFVLVSHPDGDHISGIVDLLSAGWPIGRLIVAPQAASFDEGCELIRLAEEKGTEVVYLSGGQAVRDGKVTLRCLYPEAGADISGTNDISLVIELRYKAFSLLLTGDIGAPIEAELAGRLTATSLLKVAHHGAGGSSSEDFLEKTRPLAAVISCGKNNVYGHPHPATLQRLEAIGSQIYLTMEQGAIQVTTGGQSFRISGFKAATGAP